MPRALLLTEEREALASRLNEARAQTDEIFTLLKPEALYERSIPERHRLVFYLGHLEAFDWNLVARQAFRIDAFNEGFDRLFAFGIDPVGGGLPNEPPSDWPRREAIADYNRRVRATVDECLNGGRTIDPQYDAVSIFNMAIEHRLMHAETLAYLLNQLPFQAKHAPEPPPEPRSRLEAAPRLVAVPPGTATLGRTRTDPGFGWDNEYDAITVQVPGFSIESAKTTNRRFLEFVGDGGYRSRALWSDADWAWIERERIRYPRFWIERDGGWRLRGMFAEPPLPEEAPVYVSHAEASAFARWAKGSLPTEAQFHRAAYGTPQGSERQYPWGDAAPRPQHGNFDFQRWDTTPVGSYPDGDSAFGVSELVGNGWEWTSSVFEPFPGFRPHPLYAGYSANFFDGEHYVLKGGSPCTAACFLRRSFRNWFQPHYAYVYGTFRLVKS